MAKLGSFSEIVQAVDPSPDCLFPFAPFVPTDPVENAAFREWLWDRGARFPGEREAIKFACSRDLLFFVNAFLSIKQERPVPADLPFITWPKQQDFLALLASTQRKVTHDKTGSVRGDIRAEKPREVGWTWLCCAEVIHAILFIPNCTCLLGSRVAYNVDGSGGGNSDLKPTETLFGKLDYYLEHLPTWFLPRGYWRDDGMAARKYRTTMRISIPGGGKAIGSPTHKSFGRSGRFFIMLLDEFAHVDQDRPGISDHIWGCTSSTCSLRRAVSTPCGKNNKFAKLKGNKDIEQFVVHWYDDPAKMHGAYKLEAPMTIGSATLQIGEWWAPWAEMERRRTDNDNLFAQEILLSYEGTGGPYFVPSTMRIVNQSVLHPLYRGGLLITAQDGLHPRVMRFQPDTSGCFSLWHRLLEDGKPEPRRMYGIAADVATGVRGSDGRGASNSVLCIGDLQSGEKIAEYVTATLLPHQLARVAVALAYWYAGNDRNPARMIWEANGPGGPFGAVVTEELNFTNVFRHQLLSDASAKSVRPAGFFKSGGDRGSGVKLFADFTKAIETGRYIERSSQTTLEMAQYICQNDSSAVFAGSLSSLDPSGARSNHGDTVIASALLVQLIYEFAGQVEEEVVQYAPWGSIAAEERRLEFARQEAF